MHRIRLRHPWGLEIDHAESLRVDVPDGPRAGNRASYSRSFNRPTSIGESIDVTLVIESWNADCGTVRINGEQLESTSSPDFPLQFNLRGHLQATNRVDVILESTSTALSLNGAVSLEITEPKDA